MRIGLLLVVSWQVLGAEVRELGAALESQRLWERAAELYEKALPGAASLDERFWLQTSLAEVSFERREYAQARRWLTQAEETVRGFPADAPKRARLLNAWGTLHLVQGNASAAERDLGRAAALASTPADRAAALHNLAAVEMQTGRLREAAGHEREAIELWSREFGERHHYVMKAWIGLSSIEGLRGNWRGAESSIHKALAIAETPEALANYAVVLEKLHRGREASDLRRRFHLETPAAAPLVDVKSFSAEKELAARSR